MDSLRDNRRWQSDWKARKRAQGLNRVEFWVTAREKRILKEYLAAIRHVEEMRQREGTAS